MLAEALVGRVEILALWPFSQDEIEQVDAQFVDWLFSSASPKPRRCDVDWNGILGRVERGGFPEAVRRQSAERRRSWFGSYITTILQRDVRDMSNIEGLAELPRLLSLLAARSSNLLSYAGLSRDSGIAQSTLKRYTSLLEATFLVQMLPAWATNLGKRVVKSPKVLVCDTGLQTSLLGVAVARMGDDAALTGRLLETFVAMELRKQASWSRARPSLHHYRSHAQREVDLVLEKPGGDIVGIEVKASVSIKDADLRGLHDLAEIAGNRMRRGVVFYRGDQIVPFAENVHAIPLPCLWRGVPT
jgi:predicted AAA+ superfamily ATPase